MDIFHKAGQWEGDEYVEYVHSPHDMSPGMFKELGSDLVQILKDFIEKGEFHELAYFALVKKRISGRFFPFPLLTKNQQWKIISQLERVVQAA